MRNNILLLAACGAVLALSGCRQDMHDQPRYRTYAGTSFFPDGRSARPAIDGTVARGKLKTDTRIYQGKEAGAFVAQVPYPVTKAFLERGQARYNIYCTPCHGKLGDGEGMVVKRGFKHPPTYHQDRLRNQPVGYLFDVVSNGFGSMISYASRIPVEDRWAIVSYVRVLQYSQNANPADLTDADRAHLEAPPPAAAPAAAPGGHGTAAGSEHKGGEARKGAAH